MARELLLEATALGRRFGARHAVSDVTLTARAGDVVGLLGLNGAGKTTTLRMVCGTLAPSEGAVKLCGVDLLERPLEAKRHLGYLPEIPPLYVDTSVREYLDYAAMLRRVSRRRRRPMVEHALERSGLSDVGGRMIRNLSKGYRQRVGIAQAIVHDPELIILDEPTAGLDPQQVQEIRALIRSLKQDRAVVFSSHILGEVQALCDRVVILHEGRQVYEGHPEGGGAGVGSGYRLCFRSPPALALLSQLPGLEVVERIPSGYRVVVHLDSALDALIARSVEEGWGLQELTPERPTLEQVFLELTVGREAAA